jgi:SAM-dependent methyltransferase
MFADALRKRFPNLAPVVDDLFLLEPHQIASLPERAPRAELAAVLRAHPNLVRFFSVKHPPIEPFLSELLHATPSATPATTPPVDLDLAECEDRLLWELADLIVYQSAPAMYDATIADTWTRAALAEAEPLEHKVVADIGAGTGQVTFTVAPFAKTVFAIEPSTPLREYIRSEASRAGFDNVFVLDGLLSAVPLPADTLDVLLTHRAIGWDLAPELAEIERIVHPGGVALHLTGMPFPPDDDPLHEGLLSSAYQPGPYDNGEGRCCKYFRKF